MNNRLFLCVDGGGTKTEALLADTDGRILGLGRAAGSNALSVGKENAVHAVQTAIDAALSGFDPSCIATARLFIPGFGHCLPLPYPFETPVLGDAANAYFGALGAPLGIAVLAGTGSFAVSYDEQGRQVSVGGWGPMLGDEGSGYDIGKRAVQQVLLRFDEGKQPTALGSAVLSHYGIDDASRLVHVIYHTGCDRERMAQLCPIVGEHARLGEQDALLILKAAAGEMARMARMLQSRLSLPSAQVALTGGVSGLGEILFTPLREALSGTGLTFTLPKYTPSVGGVLYTYWALTGQMPDKALSDSYFEQYKTIKERKAVC